MSHRSIDEALDLELSLAHAGSFVPMDFCLADLARGQLNSGQSLRQRPLPYTRRRRLRVRTLVPVAIVSGSLISPRILKDMRVG